MNEFTEEGVDKKKEDKVKMSWISRKIYGNLSLKDEALIFFM